MFEAVWDPPQSQTSPTNESIAAAPAIAKMPEGRVPVPISKRNVCHRRQFGKCEIINGLITSVLLSNAANPHRLVDSVLDRTISKSAAQEKLHINGDLCVGDCVTAKFT